MMFIPVWAIVIAAIGLIIYFDRSEKSARLAEQAAERAEERAEMEQAFADYKSDRTYTI
jgi:hypothetical protein